MKKYISILLAIIMLAMCLSACATQQDDNDEEVLKYYSLEEYVENSKHLHPEKDADLRYALYDNFAQVIECVSDNPDIVIPDLYKGVPVIAIREGAFADNTTMKHLTIGANVLHIGDNAFAGCTALTHVRIANNVRYLGAGAFSGCLRLTNVVIPSKVPEISSGTFDGCASLSRVVVESDLQGNEQTDVDPTRIIGAGTFSNCDHLKIMWIPEDVGTVEDSILGGSTPKPLICGGDATASSWFATLQCLDYEVVPRDEFDSHAIMYRETTSVDKNSPGDYIDCGNFTIVLNDVQAFEKLGSVEAGDNHRLVAAYFTISNNTMIPQYFDGLHTKCTCKGPSKDGLIEEFTKLPVMTPHNLLKASFPVGDVSPGGTIEGVIVLKVSERYESISILFPGAEEPFVI